MTQIDLEGHEHPTAAVRLTARQQAALDHIAARQPIPSDELGAHLHALAGIERRTAGGWCLVDWQPGHHKPSAQDDPEPFF